AKYWVRGLDCDWRQWYKSIAGERISLPTYPFDEQRYWLTGSLAQVVEADRCSPNGSISRLHPTLHQNLSDFFKYKFKSVFNGSELFFVDHKIQGQSVLPGAVMLEMIFSGIS